MRTSLSVLVACVIACSSSSPGGDGGTEAGIDAASDAPAAGDAESDATAKGDGSTCAPPVGTSCPTTAGNCLHIGDPCTKGGNQCPQPTACDLDLNPSGAGICITFGVCTPNTHACGAGATCCKTAMTSNFPVCLPNQCLPSDCTAEP